MYMYICVCVCLCVCLPHFRKVFFLKHHVTNILILRNCIYIVVEELYMCINIFIENIFPVGFFSCLLSILSVTFSVSR